MMVVEADPSLDADLLKRTLTQAMDATRCRCEGEPDVRPVNSVFYEQFKRIYDPSTNNPLNDDQMNSSANGGATLTPVIEKFKWELRLNKPNKYLKNIKLTYPDGSTEIIESNNKDRLQRIGIGENRSDFYHLKTTRAPVRFQLTVGEVDKPTETLSEEPFPKQNNYYMITLKQFSGDFNQMKDALSDEDKVAEPLNTITDVSDMRFLFTKFGFETAEPEITIAENTYTLRVDKIRKRKVDRVWVYFPLNDSQLAAILPSLRQMKPEDISKEIRQGQNREKDIVFGPNLAPSWIEFHRPGKNSPFTRAFTLEDLKNLKSKFPKLHYLIVWEFGDGDKAVPHRVKQGGADVYVSESQDRNWMFALDREIQIQGKKSATPNR